jgi:hypothetical protein
MSPAMNSSADRADLQCGRDQSKPLHGLNGRLQTAHRTGIERLAHARGVPNTPVAVNTELLREWATPLAGPAREVIYWYFTEVSKLTDHVGVAEAELLALISEFEKERNGTTESQPRWNHRRRPHRAGDGTDGTAGRPLSRDRQQPRP